MDATKILCMFAGTGCLAIPLIGLLGVVYWRLIGSRLPPQVGKLKDRHDPAGLKKALDYLNLDRDFWNVRGAAVQALSELSLLPGDPARAEQAAEGLFYAYKTGGRFVELDRVATPGAPVPYGKIPPEKFRTFCQRIEQVQLLALQALGQVGAQTQNGALRLRILDEFIQGVGQCSHPPQSRFEEEWGRIVLSALEAITGQKFGLDPERWRVWRRAYPP
jgi:hypothetical protein